MITRKWIILYLVLIPTIVCPQCEKLLQEGNRANTEFNVRLAAEYYAQAFQLCPDTKEVAIKYAHALLDVGEESEKRQSATYYEKAYHIADTLYRRFPFDVECNYLRAWTIGHMALICSNRERILLVREFEEHLQRTLTLDPNHAPAHLALGIFYREVAAIPSFVRTLAELLLGELPQGTFANALQHIQQAIQINPTFLSAVYELGKTYDIIEEKEHAVYYYQKVLSMPQVDHLDGRKILSATKKLRKYEEITAQQMENVSTILN